jgi:hypothetical protein
VSCPEIYFREESTTLSGKLRRQRLLVAVICTFLNVDDSVEMSLMYSESYCSHVKVEYTKEMTAILGSYEAK